MTRLAWVPSVTSTSRMGLHSQCMPVSNSRGASMATHRWNRRRRAVMSLNMRRLVMKGWVMALSFLRTASPRLGSELHAKAAIFSRSMSPDSVSMERPNALTRARWAGWFLTSISLLIWSQSRTMNPLSRMNLPSVLLPLPMPPVIPNTHSLEPMMCSTRPHRPYAGLTRALKISPPTAMLRMPKYAVGDFSKPFLRNAVFRLRRPSGSWHRAKSPANTAGRMDELRTGRAMFR
mmetsp:Transcript_1387/g.3006  ORF Transcript_1387/g.3006 Transcript_1387/m.3006 type:complete len:234 (-) Transcript_1387:9-710(-)